MAAAFDDEVEEEAKAQNIPPWRQSKRRAMHE